MPDLTIIVVAYNISELVQKCLKAVIASKEGLKKEIIYVDNGSTDGTSEMVRTCFPDVVLIQSATNLGFNRANNLAFTRATGKFILMLNADAFVGESTFQRTVDFMSSHPECGVLGCRLIGENGQLQESARFFYTPWTLFLNALGWRGPFLKVDDLNCPHDQVKECDWVPGCYLLTRKDLIDQMGFFLRPDYFMYNDDIDLCLRIKRLGRKVFFYPEDVIHLGGMNSKKIGVLSEYGRQIEKYALESRYIYFRKNYHIFYVLMDAYLMSLLDMGQIIKGILLMKGHRVVEKWRHLRLVFAILLRTSFGAKPIH